MNHINILFNTQTQSLQCNIIKLIVNIFTSTNNGTSIKHPCTFDQGYNKCKQDINAIMRPRQKVEKSAESREYHVS